MNFITLNKTTRSNSALPNMRRNTIVKAVNCCSAMLATYGPLYGAVDTLYVCREAQRKAAGTCIA
jgi:hypothetical protein